jgi:threonine/homoserine/homoserine lactone efflux protein
MLAFIVSGLTIGFSVSVQPGPFLAYLLSQTLTGGARRALPLTLAPLVSDGPIIALVLFALTQLPSGFLRWLQIAGGLFLIYLAYSAFQTACRAQAVNVASGVQTFRNAVLMNSISPSPWIFWSTIGGPAVLEGWALSATHAASFIAGFYLAFISGMVVFILLFATAHRLDPRVTRVLNYLAAAALLVFGGWQLWRGVTGA